MSLMLRASSGRHLSLGMQVSGRCIGSSIRREAKRTMISQSNLFRRAVSTNLRKKGWRVASPPLLATTAAAVGLLYLLEDEYGPIGA